MSFTAQTTLTEDAPVIWDLTCSTLKIWPANGLRMDINRDVRPDIQADNGCLPLRTGSVDQFYYDPPHIIENPNRISLVTEEPKYSEWFASVNRHRKGFAHQKMIHSFKRFGFWPSRAAWLKSLKQVNTESYRCLKPQGRLFVKLGETKGTSNSVKIEDIETGLSNFKELNRRITRSNSGNPTYWLTMKPTAIEPTDTKDGGIGGR